MSFAIFSFLTSEKVKECAKKRLRLRAADTDGVFGSFFGGIIMIIWPIMQPQVLVGFRIFVGIVLIFAIICWNAQKKTTQVAS